MSRITRCWRDAAFAAGLALPFAGLAGLLAWLGLAWAGWLFGAIAAGAVVLALFASCQAPCPSCGRMIHHLLAAGNEYVRCGYCARYARGEEGELREMNPARVAEEPVFSLELMRGLRLPDLCCACGAPATREEDVGGLRVPHCGAHAGGARLSRENLAPTAGFTRQAVMAGPGMRVATVLKVTSYRFYLAALNSCPQDV